MNRRTFMNMSAVGLASLLLPETAGNAKQTSKQPNILWIMVEDMSAHLSCYGETTIKTPNIDRLARQGAMFTNCFVTSPVCSPSRSAMITGMYQTTIGAHNHRSSRGQFPINLPSRVKLLPEYFRQAGYYVCNGNGGGNVDNFSIKQYRGKTDYNFVYDKSLYDGFDWSGRQKSQPFFAQIQLHGGKNRRATVPHPVDPAKVKLPPYYPDHPILLRIGPHT